MTDRPAGRPYSCTIRRMKFTTTAASSEIARMVGPNRSSIPLWPRFRMLWARQWNVTRAYIIAAMAMIVKRPAEMRPIRSPKLSRPTANPPRMTVKLSQERKVRSLAKKTLGSTRVGRAILLPVFREVSSQLRGTDSGSGVKVRTGSCLEERLAGHFVRGEEVRLRCLELRSKGALVGGKW